tara:strand:- start:1813 stop:2070 length:258 start_codon:yes stop_codon:yes gene_type:complete
MDVTMKTWMKMLKADGLDEAIIGQTTLWNVDGDVLVYSVDTIISILMNRDGLSYEEAFEFFEFNIQGSYVGDHTPLYVHTIDDEE